MPATFKKDPDARLDYKVDWTLFLSTDTIVSASTSVIQSFPAATSAGSIRIATQFVSSNSQSHVIWVSGGTLSAVSHEYDITSRVHTSGGRRNDATFTVKIESK